MRPRILIVDDEDSIRKLLKSRFDRENWEVGSASQASEAKTTLANGTDWSVMVTDVKMPGEDGISLLTYAKQKYPTLKVIVVTGHGEKELAVQALRNGASDYLEKPFDMDELVFTVKRCIKEHSLENENKDLVSRLEARIERVEGKTEDKYWYASKSASMSKVNEWMTVLKREAMRAEAEEPSVLILGESGTGKEGFARMVHTGSRRSKGPWVAVNCANFNEQLLESELFGHEKGSFTGAQSQKRGLFELAKGGTLFLDEIGEMDVKLQAKLLRVLQEKAFRRVGGTTDLTTDVRVVAATNQNLKSRVQNGGFREDLYHRLSRVVIDVPSLRERKEDIVPMAKDFAERAFKSRGKSFQGFSPDAETTMKSYTWPGNVRELLNVVERTALVFSGSGHITAKDLSITTSGSGGFTASVTPLSAVRQVPKLEVIRGEGGTTTGGTGNGSVAPVINIEEGYMSLKKQWSSSFEREYLVGLLTKHNGNVSAAARDARLDRSNFLRLLRRHSVKAQDYRNQKIAA